MVFAPSPLRHEAGAPLERSYILTSREVAELKVKAKLVVLSGGWSAFRNENGTHSVDSPPLIHLLPAAWIAAGQLVVLLSLS